MSQFFLEAVTQLKEMGPNIPYSVKLKFLLERLKENEWWKLIEANKSEDPKMNDTVMGETEPDSPNVVIYLIIGIGMIEGGWWRLTEKQRSVIREYIIGRTSLPKIAERQRVTYPTVRETYLRGIENLRISAIASYPLLRDVFIPETKRGKSKETKEYREVNRELIAKVRETEAYANRKFVAGPGRGHTGKRHINKTTLTHITT